MRVLAIDQRQVTVVAADDQGSATRREPPRRGTDRTPETSRSARALAAWAALCSLGRSGVADVIERSCATRAASPPFLCTEKRIDILNDVVLNQALVHVGDDDERTRVVRE